MASPREQQLLEVARELILEEGMISFKFVEIAKRAGISRATLYNHFRSKEDVLVSLFVTDALNTIEMFNDIANDPNLNAQERLVTALLAPVSISMEQQNKLGITFLSANPGIYTYATEERQQKLNDVAMKLRQINMQFWLQPVQQGLLKADQAQLLPVMAALYPYQRGCVLIPQSVMQMNNSINRTLQEVFDNLLKYTQPLDWQEGHQQVLFERVLKAIVKYERPTMLAC